MSMDFRVMNKACDHMVRGISCMVSNYDRFTLLPRSDPSIFIFGEPVLSGRSELKRYNPSTHLWQRISPTDPVYGWTLGAYPIFPGIPSLGSAVQVRFTVPQHNIQQIWKLSYQVSAVSCLKCNGANSVSDLTLLGDPDRAVFVKNEPKLAQDFLRMLLTPIGSNPYYTWLGTSLVDLPGSKFDVRAVESALVSQIANAAAALKNLQAQQLSIASQAVTAKEMIESVSSITVNQSPTDSRVLLVAIELYTKNHTLTTIQVPLSL